MDSFTSAFRKRSLFLWSTVLLAFFTQPARAETIQVSGFANIFGAGKTVPPSPGTRGGGILPPQLTFDSAPNQIIVFTSVSGQIQGAPGDFAPPDGVPHLVNAASYDGIAGLKSPVAVPLAGIFLGPDEPIDPVPPRLDFQLSGVGTSFNQLAPQIAQVFFIGDGLTGTGFGARQVFRVPPNATRLFLGIFDGFHLGDNVLRLPGYYEDNGGAFVATFALISIPEITIENLGAQLELSWPTQTDLVYQLEWNNADFDSSWTPLGPTVIGTGLEETVLISTESSAARFYRLMIQP